MDARMFGKELTNILHPEHKNKNSYAQIHAEKLRDHSLCLPKQAPPSLTNKSFSLKEQNSLPPLHLPEDPQMVP